jgi:hypothetical protein
MRDVAAAMAGGNRFGRWMLVASIGLFGATLWLVVGGAPRGTAPPVASVRQLMDVVVTPASKVVYDAVSTVSTSAGTIETAPKNDDEWRVVAANAAVLAEAGALLMAKGRAQAEDAWMKPAQALIEGATHALAAAKTKNVEALLDGGGEIAAACDACHAEYLPNGGR